MFSSIDWMSVAFEKNLSYNLKNGKKLPFNVESKENVMSKKNKKLTKKEQKSKKGGVLKKACGREAVAATLKKACGREAVTAKVAKA
jgi:hypothetical protein